MHKRTQYFINIEANKKDVWIDCTDHPENETSYLGFRVHDSDRVYFFYYRRPRNIKQFHEEHKEYQKMMEGGETRRIVGITPDESATNSKYLYFKGIPERFINTPKKYRRDSFVCKVIKNADLIS